MKRFLRIILLCMLLSTSMCTFNVSAETKYLRKPTIKNVNVDKQFVIEFSKEISEYSATNRYIKVYTDDKKEQEVSVKVSLDSKDKTKVIVKPNLNYVQGKKYKLVIPAGVESVDGEILGKGYIQPFVVKNFYEGLPIESGLLIVGNKAYSMKYIADNSSVKNEIIKGKYKVFYVDETMKDKIKDVLGGKFVDGTKLPPGYNFNKPMYYIDAVGTQHIYVWDDKNSQFKEVKPEIKLEVTVNSHDMNDKVLMVRVKDVQWLKNAAYYKLNSSNTYYKIDEPSIFSTNDYAEKITLYSSSMTRLGEADLSTFVEGVYTRKLKLFEALPEGNSAGNIVNNGYVSSDEQGNIVYNNTGDGDRLYKNDTNGLFHSVISDDYAQYINVVDEWIYYSNYSDKGKLYKMKIDGSKKEKLNDDLTAFVTVMGEYIYYVDYSNHGRITKIRKDGTDGITDEAGLEHGTVLSNEIKDEAYFINIVGDWIYYSNKSDHHRVYAINMDGTYRVRISDEGASSIQVVGEWIYYTTNKGNLKKVKKDGTKETKDLGGVVARFDRGYFFNVVDDWIYYSNAEDNNRLYKIRTDGTDNMRLTREEVTYINVAYNTIYFVSNNVMYTVPTHTTGGIRPVPVQKIENEKKVIQVEDVKVTIPYEKVNYTIEALEDEYLPTKVPGILSDNRMSEFVVQWDRKSVQVVDGVRMYKGKLIGYNQYINLEMEIPSEMLNGTTTIEVFNNSGQSSGYIDIYSPPIKEGDANIPPKLREGDIITIYSDKELQASIRSTVVKRDGKYNRAIFTGFDMDKYGTKEYYISIKREGKSKSKGTKITLGEAPIITNSIHKPVRDIDDEGLGIDGRDFFIEEMRTTINKGVTGSYIYLSGSGQLSLQSGDAIPFDQKVVPTGIGLEWQGREWQDEEADDKDKVPMNIDSYGYKLTGTAYYLYLVSNYEDTGSPDNSGSTPRIIGHAVSLPAQIQVKSEGLPAQPSLVTQTKKYGDFITLGTTPRSGEEAYLIPIWEDYFENEGEYGYKDLLQDDKNESEYDEKTGVIDSKDWLETARVWLKEDGPWPFDEEHPAINQGIITRIDGDGRQNKIQVPKGVLWSKEREQRYYDEIDSLSKEKLEEILGMPISTETGIEKAKIKLKNNVDKYYAPKVRYRLVIKNEIGVSYVSNGVLTVDNKPPIVVREYHEGVDKTQIVAGDRIRFQSRNEKATVYITYTEDHLDTIAELEEAMSVGRVFKYEALKGVTKEIESDGIKPRLKEGSNRFVGDGYDSPKKGYIKIGVADDVGNIRFIEGITDFDDGTRITGMFVYVDNAELEVIYDAAIEAKKNSSETGYVFNYNVDELNKLIDKIEELELRIESENLDVFTTQKEVDDVAKYGREKLIDLGIPYEGVEDTKTLMRNYLANLRHFDNRDVAVDLNNVKADIFLPTELKYKDTSIGTIEWSVDDTTDDPRWFNLSETQPKGMVTIPSIPNPKDYVVRINADYRPNGYPPDKKQYEFTIKAKKFSTIVDAKDERWAIIFKKDVPVTDISDITVELKDPADDTFKDRVIYAGAEYYVVVNDGSERGGDYDIKIIVDGVSDPAVIPTTMDVQISLGDVIFNNQITVEVKNDGTAIFTKQ